MKNDTTFMNIRPLYALYLITILHGVTAYHIHRHCHDLLVPLFASGLAMEYGTWLVSGNHLENRIF